MLLCLLVALQEIESWRLSISVTAEARMANDGLTHSKGGGACHEAPHSRPLDAFLTGCIPLEGLA